MITTVKEEKIVEEKEYDVYACNSQHGITSFSYRFQEKDRPGKFFPEKAKSLGIPEGKAWHQLQSGESIDVNGATILPGLVDSHFHLSNFGKRLEMINLKMRLEKMAN